MEREKGGLLNSIFGGKGSVCGKKGKQCCDEASRGTETDRKEN
jgi:hypothetical protein